MWNIVLLTVLSGILGQIIHPIVFILYWTIGFQRYTETEPSKQSELLAKLKVKNSTITRDAKPFGIIYGKWFVGYISESEAEKKDGGEILDIIISIKRDFFRPTEIKHTYGNSNKAKKILNWKAKTNFKTLVKIMCDAEIEKYN